jgi:divalent metal cation (Fe/Co/Zn/Cd) transporter
MRYDLQYCIADRYARREANETHRYGRQKTKSTYSRAVFVRD